MVTAITIRDSAAGEARAGPSLLLPAHHTLQAPGGAGARAGRALRELSPQTWRFLTLFGSSASDPQEELGVICLPVEGRIGRHLTGLDPVPATL